jgi:hypothetical protein
MAWQDVPAFPDPKCHSIDVDRKFIITGSDHK